MSSKKKSKFQKKTIASLVAVGIALSAIGYQWFYSVGASWLLQNIPSWVFHYWPSLHTWLNEQSTMPSLLVLARSSAICLFGVGLAIVANRLRIKF